MCIGECSSIVLPVGISFYTFETLSYTLDVYRRKLKPAASLLDFGLFVSFFPHLVAGPIVRAADFLYQLEHERFIEARRLGWGLFMMTLGLFEKMVLADSLLASSADAVFGNPGPTSQLDSWLGTIAFAPICACGGSRQSPPLRTPEKLNAEERAGLDVYMRECNGCHPQGDGGLGPALNDKPVPAVAIEAQVRQGLGAMPSFSEEDLTEAELDALTAFITATGASWGG